MTTIVNTKIGETRGLKRVWLEGQKLVREGYAPGMRFDVEIKGTQVLLNVNDEGKYIVSKRQRNGRVYPIIDLTAQELAAVFDGIEMLRIAIKSGTIVISAHHQHDRVKDRVARLLDKVTTGKPLDTCSLFHGGGFLDSAIHHGLAGVGVRSRLSVAVEIESKYLDASLRNNPELWDEKSVAIEAPVQTVSLSRNPPPVDVLIGGIPCVGASLSGRAKNKLEFAEAHNGAGALFFSFLQFVDLLNPSIVVIENVVPYQSTASMAVIRSVLASLDYELHETVLNGNEFGALENRDRMCAVAVSKGVTGFDLSNLKPVREKESCLNDVLDDIPASSNRWKSFDYLAEKEKRDKAAGKGFARQLLDGTECQCGTLGAGYAKARSTEPFIRAPHDPSLSRLLTPVEHCRVKGAPERMIEGLSDTTAHQVLGNSVIYPAFQAVGNWIGSELRDWAASVVTDQVEHRPAAPVQMAA